VSTRIAGKEPIVITGISEGPVHIVDLDWPGDCGAESVFVGRTRSEEHAQHGPLQRLEYEIYGDMAGKLLEAMAHEAVRQFGCQAVRLIHASGPVEIGQASIVIQTAAAHRAEAFAACRFLIERVKHQLPVWKHEIWERGRTFVEGCCAHND